MPLLLTYLKQACRSLLKAPGFTLTVLVVLGLGIGTSTAMFSLLQAALFRPLPFQEPDRLVYCASTYKGQSNPQTSAPDFYDFQDQARGVLTLSALYCMPHKALLQGREGPENILKTYASWDLFRNLGIRPSAGRLFTAEEARDSAPPVALVSEALARRRFGTPLLAVGQNLLVNEVSRVIVGVLPAGFKLCGNSELWTPMTRESGPGSQARKFHNWIVLGRLQPGVNLTAAQARVDLIAQRLEQAYPDSDREWGLRLQPLQAQLAADQKPRLLLLMGAVSLLLLIACTNVAGLLFARGAIRQPELAIRAALGATRGQLVTQLLAESVLLSLAAGLLGSLLAFWLKGLIPLTADLSRVGIAAPGFSWATLGFALACSLGTGLLFGAIPALRLSKASLTTQFGQGTRATGARTGVRTRNALVVDQVALALVMLAMAGLLMASLGRLQGVNPGFNPRQLLTGEVLRQAPVSPTPQETERVVRFFQELREGLAAIPGVTGVAMIDRLPIRDGGNTLRVWAADNPPEVGKGSGSFHKRTVLPGYHEAMEIPMRAGRSLGDGDRLGGPLATVLSESMAKSLFPGRSPLGQTVMVDQGEQDATAYRVVGVCGDVRLEDLTEGNAYAMYCSFYQQPTIQVRFALRTTLPPLALGRSVREVVAARDREMPVEELASMEEVIGLSLANAREAAFTMGLFSILALLLSSLGLFGVLSFVVGQRTREIGVRMALGADAWTIVGEVVSQCLVLTAMGIGLGFVAALVATRLIASQLYGVRPADPTVLALAALAVAAVSVAASVLPAFRAASVNPTEALRAQ